LVVNDSTFLILNLDYLFPLYNKKENGSKIWTPIYVLPYFSNPELINLNVLPGTIYIQSLYYSIGVLVTFCLLNKYLLVANEIKDWSTIDNILYQIKNTKIYWFLKRCLDDEPKKRRLLLI